MTARAFARVEMQGTLVAHSPKVIGMQKGIYPDRSGYASKVIFGVYCFKLAFTPVSVIASAIPDPEERRGGLTLFTAGPNITGIFAKDENGYGIECPAGFQDAAVVCLGPNGRLTVPYGGFFVVFD